jgi:hypothetical protein
MPWPKILRSLFSPKTGSRLKPATNKPALEHLEERVVPYSVSGDAWAHPELITISFMPDGTPMSSQAGSNLTSNLFSTFNAKFGSTAAWQNQILKAAQTWAQQTNINFAVVTDNGASSGAGSYQQGDPGFGDIRIGGYNFGSSTLARAFMPASDNNYSIAGDVAFNTGQTFNLGSTYDLYTVAVHELGHSLGMDHTTVSSSAQMYASYTGAKSGLTSDDAAGIRDIYSNDQARSADAYDTAAANSTAATASNLNAPLSGLAVNGLDITTTSDVDFYTFTAPSSASTAAVKVQSSGLSLLAPKLTVYAADQSTVLGTANGLNQYGTTLTVNLSGLTAGQRYYVKVQGADTTAFGTGRYALTLSFNSGAAPAVARANTQTANGTPLSGSGGAADGSADGDSLLADIPAITGISPDTGADPNDAVTSATRLSLTGVAAPGTTIQVSVKSGTGLLTPFRNIGTTVAAGDGIWSFNYTGTSLSDGNYTFKPTAINLVTGLLGTVTNLLDPYVVTIDTHAPGAPVISGFGPDTGTTGDGVTSNRSPVLSGTAEASSTVNVYLNGQLYDTTAADGSGRWTYTVRDALADGTYSFTATATDLAGNVSAASAALRVTVDSTAPSAPTLGGVSRTTNTLGQQVLVIGGRAQASSTVAVYSGSTLLGSTVADALGNWAYRYTSSSTFANGTYNFTARATDAAGNASPVSANFKLLLGSSALNLAAPVLSTASVLGVDSLGNVTASATPVFSGTATAGTLVTVVDGNTVLGTVVADSSGHWSFTSPRLAAGRHSIAVFATDAQGNAGLLSAPLAFQV